MRVGRALRRLVIARIENQVADLGGRVFDQATVEIDYPYCTLGPSDWTKLDADCIDGKSWSLQVDIWHSKASKGALEDLVDDVSEALEDLEDNDLAMHPISIRLARVMDDPSGDLHGVIQIEAMVDA